MTSDLVEGNCGISDSTRPRFGQPVVLAQVCGDLAGHGAAIADLTHIIPWAGAASVTVVILEPTTTIPVIVSAILTSTSTGTKAM